MQQFYRPKGQYRHKRATSGALKTVLAVLGLVLALALLIAAHHR